MISNDQISVLASQQQSRKEKHQLPLSCLDSNDTTVIIETQLTMKTKSGDLVLQMLAAYRLAYRKKNSATRWKEVRTSDSIILSDKYGLVVR